MIDQTSMEAGSSSKPLQGLQKPGGHGSVDGSVVGGERDCHDGADFDTVAFDDRPLEGCADGEDADLRQIQDRVELLGAEHAQVRDRECAAGELLGRRAYCARGRVRQRLGLNAGSRAGPGVSA